MYQNLYKHFKMIDYNPQLNIFYSYITLFPTDYPVSCYYATFVVTILYYLQPVSTPLITLSWFIYKNRAVLGRHIRCD